MNLPTELRNHQRTLVKGHNRRLLIIAAVWLLLAAAATKWMQTQLAAGLSVLAADFALMIFAVAFLLRRLDARQCTQLGFVCGSCAKPLYKQSDIHGHVSPLLTRGVCPHCNRSVLGPNAPELPSAPPPAPRKIKLIDQ